MFNMRVKRVGPGCYQQDLSKTLSEVESKHTHYMWSMI